MATVTAALPASALTQNTWTDAGLTGLWSNPGNWSLGHTPQVNELVVLDSTSNNNMSIDQPPPGGVGGFEMHATYVGVVAVPSNVTFTTPTFVLSGGQFSATGNSVLNVTTMSIGSGTFSASPTSVLNLRGNLTGTTTFGIVNLAGSGQVITGNNTFACRLGEQPRLGIRRGAGGSGAPRLGTMGAGGESARTARPHATSQGATRPP
jgi:hypothetical protein